MSTIQPKASTTIPYIFRFIVLYLETALAFTGVIELLTFPGIYISQVTRESITELDPPLQLMTTQLAGGWLLMFFIEGIALRMLDDVRVWRILLLGTLFFDALYFYSLPQAVGGWSEWVVLSNWTGSEWLVAAVSFPFTATRLAIVLGVGLKKEKLHGA